MPARTHGMTARGATGKRPSTYSIWATMKARCHNPRAPGFQYYGARGITVCDRRRDSFENFLADMGEQPVGKSLDRIDNAGNYEPGNCRWATASEQMRHTRASTMVTFRGETKSVPDWCDELGLHYESTRMRIQRGMAPEKAFEHGRRPPRKKLSDELIAQIKAASGSQKAVADRFGVSQTYVGMLRRGEFR